MKCLVDYDVLDLSFMQFPKNIDYAVTCVKDPVNRRELEYEL